MRRARKTENGKRFRGITAGFALLTLASVVGLACATDGSAQVRSGRPLVRDDTTSITKLLDVVRGVDPMLCELATRTVDMHGNWSRWGRMSDDPMQFDSTSAVILDWVQHSHNDPALVPILRSGMHDPDSCVRRVSGSFLGRVEHPSATEALLIALDDPSPGTRYVAAMGLGMGERSVGVGRLISRLRDDSAPVRRASAWALGAMEALPAREALIDLLGRDPDPRVRQVAAWALGRIAG